MIRVPLTTTRESDPSKVEIVGGDDLGDSPSAETFQQRRQRSDESELADDRERAKPPRSPLEEQPAALLLLDQDRNIAELANEGVCDRCGTVAAAAHQHDPAHRAAAASAIVALSIP